MTRSEHKAVSSVPRYAWVILLVVWLAGMAAPLNQFKVPPVLPVLIHAFNLDLASAGMLMSVFAITGLILALPAGFILQRFGPKVAGLTALAFVALGAVMGALSGTADLLLASRFVEGIGMGLVAVVAPAAIAMWFPAEKRGTPMGLWATWVPVGSIIMYNIGPALAASFGWQAVWWVGGACALLIFVLYGRLFRLPAPQEMAPESAPARGGASSEKTPSPTRAMANRHIWLLSLQFLCFNVATLALGTFYPTFLNTVRGYGLASASFTASLVMMGTIVSAPLGGWLSDRIGSRKIMIVVPLVALALLFLFPYSVTGWWIPALAILMGVVGGAIPTATFAAVSEVMNRPQLVGAGMAVLALGQNLGMFIGPWAFGRLIETTAWTTAGYLLIPVCLLGAGAAWLVKVR